MNEDVIVNYYLSVGASFKDSDYWKEACEKNSDNITRAGRFGIGFLATFLLGERITVITRHIKDSKGFIFSVTKDDEVINAERIDTVEIGTTISVDLSDNAIDFFNKAYNGRTIRWNEWYHFTDPQIEYYMNSAKLLPEINYQVPPEKTVDRKWFYVESDLFRDVKYGFFPVNSRTNSRNIHRSFLGDSKLLSNVILNGFIVNEDLPFVDVWGLPDQAVICSIIDDKNNLELDLSRKSINYNHPVFEAINIEIWKWQLASILCCDIPAKRKPRKNKRAKIGAYYDIKSDYPDGLLMKEDAFSFWHPYFLEKLHLDKLYILKEPLQSFRPDLSVQTTITDSEYPKLIYRSSSFMDLLKKTSTYKVEKSEHIFNLVKLSGTKLPNDCFMELIDDLFSDVEDLWIPYNFSARQQKFKKAFHVLSNYCESGKLELRTTELKPLEYDGSFNSPFFAKYFYNTSDSLDRRWNAYFASGDRHDRRN